MLIEMHNGGVKSSQKTLSTMGICSIASKEYRATYPWHVAHRQIMVVAKLHSSERPLEVLSIPAMADNLWVAVSLTGIL